MAPVSADWEAIDRAEERLESRSAQRRSELARRERRRRILPWVMAPLILPVAGATALLAIVQSAGGDLGGWPASQAAAVVAAAFAVPAAVSVWVARRQGVFEAAAWAVVCVCAQVTLVFGVGFLALGLGPD
jgi:hypothetical protein